MEHDKQVFDGRVGERKQLNKLEEIASDLEDMIEPLADKVLVLLDMLAKLIVVKNNRKF